MVDTVIGVGTQLLSAIINEQSHSVFRQINPLWFTSQDERDLYNFISTHFRNYGVFPTVDTILDNGLYVEEVPDSSRYYLTGVSDRHIYRLANDYHDQLSMALDRRDMDSYKLISQQMRIELSGAGVSPDILTLDEVSNQYMDDVHHAMFTMEGLQGVTFGYDCVDDATGGMLGGELALIVARLKMGKSYILLYMMVKAWLSGKSILFTSMEMPPKQLAGRIIAMIYQINPTILKKAELSSFRFDDIIHTIRGFDNRPPINFVGGNFRKSTSDIFRYASELSPDLCIVDGAYLLSPRDKNKRTAKHEILADVANEMKADAVDLNIPYLATVQFNRSASETAKRGRVKGDLDIAHIAGTDELAWVADYVFAVANISGESNKRRIKLLATRDSASDADFIVNFKFSPPNFSYFDDYVDEVSSQSGGVGEAKTMAEVESDM